jgi:hypothetical protein
MVTLNFNLVGRHADQSKANQDVQTKAAKIFEILDGRKIGKGDVVASDLKSNPQFGENDAQRGKIIGYSVTRAFEVVVHELPVFPKLVDELLSIPGVEFTNIAGGVANQNELRDELRSKALEDARDQAEKALRGAGMKIDAIFAISPVPFPEISARIFRSDGVLAVTDAVIMTGAPEYRIGPLTIRQDAHVIYLISPAK